MSALPGPYPVKHRWRNPRHEWANMILVANLILQAAFLRTESRGCHFRSDFPRPIRPGNGGFFSPADATDRSRIQEVDWRELTAL